MVALPSNTRWRGVADGFSAIGYFRVAERDGVFWLVDPEGGRFVSKGVNTVRLDQDRVQNSGRIPYAEACLRKYGNQDAWRAAVARRLARWGFNTLGAWSDEAVASAGPCQLRQRRFSIWGCLILGETADERRSQSKNFRMRSIRRSSGMCVAGAVICAAGGSKITTFLAGSSTTNCAGRRIGAAAMNC